MKKLLLLIACAAMFVGCGCSNSKTSSNSIYYTKADYVFSPSEELLEKSIDIAADGDREAFDQMVRDGQIYMFKDNAEVYIVESGLGIIKVRLKGSTTEVWTVREAVSETYN